MRKLPWHDADVKSYLICCMVNIWNVKYNSIHCVANLLAGLVAYQEDVGIHVVDGVLEDIRLGMEVCVCEILTDITFDFKGIIHPKVRIIPIHYHYKTEYLCLKKH